MIIDFTFLENICNLNCKYCRGGYEYDTSEKRINDNVYLNINSRNDLSKNPFIKDFFIPNGKDFLLPVTAISKSIIHTLDSVDKLIPIELIKISGGEISLFPDVMDALSKSDLNQKEIKILSNGTCLKIKDILSWKKYISDLIIQISLDGINSKSNSNRVYNKKTLLKIKELITQLANHQIPVEINSVLTKQSIDDYFNLLEWLLEIGCNFTVYPRPVRNIKDDRLFPSKKQIENFIQSIENLNEKSKALFIDESYIHRLCNSFHNKPKNYCKVPNNVLALSLTGNINHCTIGGTPLLGNMFEDAYILNKISSSNSFLPSNCWEVCDSCISEYEVFNIN